MTEIYWNPPDPEPPENYDHDPEPLSQVWFKYEIEERENDIIVYESTNDNLDQGYPSEYAAWDLTFKTLESALKHTGKSRTGINGAEVTVSLNGEKI